jgi:hypothetical protein
VKRAAPLGLFILTVLFLACSSSSGSSQASRPGKGFRVLDAVVAGRTYDPPGAPGTSFGGSGNWFLEFEAKDGPATVHYRFPVTRSQYNRYQEGDRVQLVMADDRLNDIRPAF